MNAQPFAILLKLVASHPQPFTHAPKLLCPFKVHKLIGLGFLPMLALVASNPVIIHKRRQCNQCNSATNFLNLFICVVYMCISHISSYFHFY